MLFLKLILFIVEFSPVRIEEGETKKMGSFFGSSTTMNINQLDGRNIHL